MFHGHQGPPLCVTPKLSHTPGAQADRPGFIKGTRVLKGSLAGAQQPRRSLHDVSAYFELPMGKVSRPCQVQGCVNFTVNERSHAALEKILRPHLYLQKEARTDDPFPIFF